MGVVWAEFMTTSITLFTEIRTLKAYMYIGGCYAGENTNQHAVMMDTYHTNFFIDTVEREISWGPIFSVFVDTRVI